MGTNLDATIIISAIVFFVIIVMAVLFRRFTGNKYEVKNSDIVLALIPVMIGLLITGKIKSFQFGDLKVETAIVQASQAAIEEQVVELKGLPVE